METGFILITCGDFHDVFQVGNDFAQMRPDRTGLRPRSEQGQRRLFVCHAIPYSIGCATLDLNLNFHSGVVIRLAFLTGL